MMSCSHCGSRKHPASHCPKSYAGQAARHALRCSYCGSRKHNRDACPKAWPGPRPVALRD